MVESEISHGELLGITETTYYKKRDIDTKDIETINKHLDDLREAEHGKAEEMPVTAETVELGVDKTYHKAIREMLRGHEHLWNGTMGQINITQHTIDLVPGARRFKSAPYRAGPKTRELDQFEIDKQLKAGVIEPSN